MFTIGGRSELVADLRSTTTALTARRWPMFGYCCHMEVFYKSLGIFTMGKDIKYNWLTMSKPGDDVSVVIVNYNTKDILWRCLSNLKTMEDGVKVIVVDNDSNDGSVEMVAREYPGVECVALRENLGLAAGNNVGLSKVKTKYVLFMGSDAFPKPNAISILREYMESHKDVAISVGEVKLRSGGVDIDTHRGFPTPWVALTHFGGLERLFPRSRLFGGYYLGFKDFTKTQEIDLCTTHFMFTRRKIFSDVGMWDESFFVYGEDVDMCWRVKKAGWKIVLLPESKIVHYKGVSVGTRRETQDITKATEETKGKMVAETTRAMMIFYKKHFGDRWYSGLVILGITIMGKLRTKK